MAFSFDSLNTAQRDAVNHLDGPLLVLAGAGTGKTRTVICRIAHMLKRGIKPEEILAVTFTNKAAREMQDRIGGMVSRKQAKLMTVSTFHSLCVRVLREDISVLGYKKNFAIFAGNDQQGLAKQLIIRKGGSKEKLKPGEVLSVISKQKNAGEPMEDIEDDLIASIAIAYQNELRAQNAVDFDDLLILAERALREHAPVRHKWQARYSRITVDEFQDTNGLQMSLLQQLVPAPYHLCVVGDDDQSIYGWRGADVANILEFERFFPNPKIVRLEENYRSSQAILDTANSLIRHNAGRREKQLRATKAGGELVRVISMPGDDEEADWVAEDMLVRNGTQSRRWEELAVLFRTNGQIRRMEMALRNLKIPYRLIGAQSFYDRSEVRDVMAYVQVLNDPTTDLGILRILNSPPRGIGQSTAMLAIDHSRDLDQPVWSTLRSDDFLNSLSTKAANSIRQFVLLISQARAKIEDGGPARAAAVLKDLIDETDYEAWILRQCKTDRERDQRREGIYDSIVSLREAGEKGKTLQQFLDAAALAADRETDDVESKSGVTLITMHASKGLEFPIVYLVGLEQGILPHIRSVNEGTLDEERRLLYVAITRAEESLVISYCSTRKKYGDIVSCLPSKFLDELDETFIITEDYEDIMGAEASDDELDSFFGAFRTEVDE